MSMVQMRRTGPARSCRRSEAARRASCGTAAHFDLSGLPVDFRVVLPEPGVPEDEFLFPETGHDEYGALAVGPVAHDNIGNLPDASGLVRGTVNIVDRNWLGEPANRNLVRRDVFRINEVGRRSAVYEAVNRELHRRIRGLDPQRKVEASWRWGSLQLCSVLEAYAPT